MQRISILIWMIVIGISGVGFAGNTWSTARGVSPPSIGAQSFPEVAINADGLRAIIVWQTYDNVNTFTSHASFSSDGGANWGVTHDFMSQSIGDSLTNCNPRVAMSANGKSASVVWQTFDNIDTYTCHASITSDGGASWGTESSFTQTSIGGSSANTTPQVAMSASGESTIVVWQTFDNINTYTCHAAITSDGGTSWNIHDFAKTSVQDQSANAYPQVAMDASGQSAIVAWQTFDNTLSEYTCHASITVNGGSTWSSEWDFTNKSTIDVYTNTYPQVAMSADGNKAIVVWQTITDSFNYYSNCYASITSDAGASWSAYHSFSPTTNGDANSQVAMNDDGSHIIVVWQSYVGGFDLASYASITSDAGANWSVAHEFSPSSYGGVCLPQVDISADGKSAVLTWQTLNVFANGACYAALTFDEGASWNVAPKFLPIVFSGYPNPQIAINAEGNSAILTWQAYDDFGHAISYTSIYPAPPPPPPSASGKKIKVLLAMQSYYANRLMWSRSKGASIFYYNIYRNSDRIATVPFGTFKYIDQPVEKNRTDIYEIRAVGNKGIEGDPIRFHVKGIQ